LDESWIGRRRARDGERLDREIEMVEIITFQRGGYIEEVDSFGHAGLTACRLR